MGLGAVSVQAVLYEVRINQTRYNSYHFMAVIRFQDYVFGIIYMIFLFLFSFWYAFSKNPVQNNKLLKVLYELF